MHRHLIGLAALGLFAGGLAWRMWSPAAATGETAWFCWRAGLLLAVAWLAYDELMRMPSWLLAALPVAILLLAKRPRWLLLAVPLALLLALLRPRMGRGRK